jgi:hypothetical protein
MAKIVKVSREEANRRLGNVPDDKRFWCQDGKVVKNLKELEEALNNMSDETFHYHSVEDKNDFSNWVRDVVGDTALANQLQKATTQATSAYRVETRLNWLRARL